MPIYQSQITGTEKPVYYELSYGINGVLFAVHNELGRFRSEKQYGDALERHLELLRLKFEREKALPKSFVGEAERRNVIDFLIDDKIILEIKAKRVLERSDYYQAKRYLIALNKKLALLVNFRDRFLRPKRILNSRVDE